MKRILKYFILIIFTFFVIALFIFRLSPFIVCENNLSGVLPTNVKQQIIHTIGNTDCLILLFYECAGEKIFVDIYYPFPDKEHIRQSWSLGITGPSVGVGIGRHLRMIMILDKLSGYVYLSQIEALPEFDNYDLDFWRKTINDNMENKLKDAASSNGWNANIVFSHLPIPANSTYSHCSWFSDSQPSVKINNFFKDVQIKPQDDIWNRFHKPRFVPPLESPNKQWKPHEVLIITQKMIHSPNPHIQTTMGTLTVDSINDFNIALNEFSKKGIRLVVFVSPDFYNDPERSYTAQRIRHFVEKKDMAFCIATKSYDKLEHNIPGIDSYVKLFWEKY